MVWGSCFWRAKNTRAARQRLLKSLQNGPCIFQRAPSPIFLLQGQSEGSGLMKNSARHGRAKSRNNKTARPIVMQSLQRPLRYAVRFPRQRFPRHENYLWEWLFTCNFLRLARGLLLLDRRHLQMPRGNPRGGRGPFRSPRNTLPLEWLV